MPFLRLISLDFFNLRLHDFQQCLTHTVISSQFFYYLLIGPDAYLQYGIRKLLVKFLY